MTMTVENERFDDWALYKEAQYLANMLQQEHDLEDGDVYNSVYEVCEGHEWAISYYRALRVVAENDTVEAEESVRALYGNKQFDSIAEHACAIVRELLVVAVLTELDDRGVEI